MEKYTASSDRLQDLATIRAPRNPLIDYCPSLRENGQRANQRLDGSEIITGTDEPPAQSHCLTPLPDEDVEQPRSPAWDPLSRYPGEEGNERWEASDGIHYLSIIL